MSQQIRQSNLFAGEDFTKVYKSFKNIDFTSYDYDSIRNSLIEYLRINYPENFNDYIQSSEYVALIELLSMLGTSIAFRTDLNSRENFLDTAERKESIIRLARQLSYTPSRNYPASGLFKIVAIQTTDSVEDSSGRNLGNSLINWNDTTNPDSFEQFITVLNSAFTSTNKFGVPSKRGTVGTIPTELYPLNNLKGVNIAYPITIGVDGENLPFDVVNPDFIDNGYFYETHPDANAAFSLIYRNDGSGNFSSNTGFFLMFKQGTIRNLDYRFDFPLKDRSVDIDLENINETDVFVQEISESGSVLTKWTKVPNVNTNNIVYNNITLSERNIYSVESRYADKITLKFPDGNFGEIPVGIYRAWVRQSANKYVNLKPDNIGVKEITISYVNSRNQTHLLRVLFTLESNVSNSIPSETTDQIKVRAPQVYYTQNRMVNAEDYNVFPLSQGNQILKIKSINRTYSGHSRYIDLNDSTGFYKDLIINGDDGALYKEYYGKRFVSGITSGVTSEKMIKSDFQETLGNVNLVNFFYDEFYRGFIEKYKVDNTTKFSPFSIEEIKRLKSTPSSSQYDADFTGLYWRTQPSTHENETGYFAKVSSSQTTETIISNNLYVNLGIQDCLRYIREGTVLHVRTSSGQLIYSTILQINNYGIPGSTSASTGPVVMSTAIPENSEIIEILPPIRTTLTENEITSLVSIINNRQSCYIDYDLSNDSWYIFNSIWGGDENDLRNDYTYGDWLIAVAYKPITSTNSVEAYAFVTRGLKYIFESFDDVRFYLDSDKRAYDPETGKSLIDEIIIPSHNVKSSNTETWEFNGTHWYNNQSELYYTHPYIVLSRRESVVDKVLRNNAVTSNYQYSNGLLLLSFTPAVGDTLSIETSTDEPIGKDIIWNSFAPVILEDGHVDQRKVEVVPVDRDGDGFYDRPLLFSEICSPVDKVIFSKTVDLDGYSYFTPYFANIVEFKGNVTVSSVSSYLVVDNYAPIDIRNFDMFVFSDTEQFEGFISNIVSLPENNEKELFMEAMVGKYLLVSNVSRVYKLTDVIYSSVSSTSFSIANVTGSEIDLRYGRSFGQNKTKNGRNFGYNKTREDYPLFFIWKHYSSFDHRIDPSVSNIVDMYLITDAYYQEMLVWKLQGAKASAMPETPTTEDLRVQFEPLLSSYKMISDQIIYKPGKFKNIFGSSAPQELQATFKVVKAPNTTVTDNEIKSRVIEAVDMFFEVSNWDFGESFYFTELSAFIHRQLSGVISSVVIVPVVSSASFGDLFQIKSEPDEIFLSTASVKNVEIVSNLTDVNLRMRK